MQQRLAIVTGAARGIGAGIARRLSRDGLAVALFDLDRSPTDGFDGPVTSRTVDVSNEAQVKDAVASVAAELGAPTVLVNNAGFARDGGFAAMPTEDWDAVMGVHLRGAFLMTRAVQPYMADAGYGRIVSISSISAQGHANRANYCAAKAGLHGFTKSIAVELGPLGITANVVAPGLVVTRMTDATAARRGLSLDAHLADAVTRIPVRRAGTPDDIAHAVSFFASEAAGFVTGQVLYVAGGPHD